MNNKFNNMKRLDNILLILSKYDKVKTATKLEKLCYILDEKTDFKFEGDYNWEWDECGWTSLKFYDDLLFLINLGLVDKKDIGSKNTSDEYAIKNQLPEEESLCNSIFFLSNKGEKIVKQLKEENNISDDDLSIPKRYESCNSLNQILEIIYDEYEENKE
ncbi:MAG: hypothetical protein ACOCP8_05335 [archaeon]